MSDRGRCGAPESYEAAVERLEAIILRLDSGKAELRETLELCREGKALVEYCKVELEAVSGELEDSTSTSWSASSRPGPRTPPATRPEYASQPRAYGGPIGCQSWMPLPSGSRSSAKRPFG